MLTIVLRFAHVFFGALWVGMMAFQTFVLMPAFMEVGPDAGKVTAAIMKRRLPMFMPIFALLNLVSGMWLLQRMSGGAMGAFMNTAMGQAFAWGGAIAVLAFLIGIFVMRPAMMRSMKLAESLPALPPDQRSAGQAEIQRLRARGATVNRLVTIMLLVTLALMSVARYL